MEEGQKGISIFLDASVIITATISQKGGSFRILTEARLREFELITSHYAFQESQSNIKNKYPHLLDQFHSLTGLFKLVDDAKENLVKQYMEIIDFKDAPILASAVWNKADTLLTLDRKHFIENPKLKRQNLSLKILTPGDFIKRYF